MEGPGGGVKIGGQRDEKGEEVCTYKLAISLTLMQ
jgi:hypothetical protein